MLQSTSAKSPHLLTRMPLLALALAAFGIGTSEFIIMGLLPDLARDFGVSIPRAGALVSAYALTVTVGSPFIALLVARMERKRALLLLMSLFTVGNVACALAPSYNTLFAARILTALSHGAFFGIGSVVAANLVPRTQRSKAIALMFSGLTLANVLGVPAGTALGQALGWRAAFWAIVPIGVAAAGALVALVPRQPASTANLLHEFHVLRRPTVLLTLALSVSTSTSLFCIFTYIAPMLLTVTRVSPHVVTVTLVFFGVGITAGNLIGGHLADWRPMLFLNAILCVLFTANLLLPLAEPYAVPAVIAILLWGAIQFAAGAPLQSRIVDHAAAAPNLASTLNQGAFNFGNAMGASLGGILLTAGWSYRQLPYASAAVTLVALALALLSARLDRKQAALLSNTTA